jgi:hypothetical protein
MLAAVLSQEVASASAPTSVMSSTIKAASLHATGQGARGLLSPTVLGLAEGVIRAMFVTKMKLAAVLVLMVTALGIGGGMLVWHNQAAGIAPVARREGQKTEPAGRKRPVEPPLEDPQVVEAIKAAGGEVTFWKEGRNRWTKVEFLGGKGTDADLKLLKGLRHLRTLNLGKQFTDAGLAHLKDVKTVRTINWGCDVSDAGLAYLKGWTRLELIHIWDSSITGTGLEHLKGLPLKHLSILSARAPGYKQFNDAGMAQVKGFPKLEILSVAGGDITDAGLAHLQGMVHLRHLTLVGDGITDKGLAHLEALAKGKLEGLEILCPGVTDAGLDHLKGMTNLKSLNLCATPVTENGLLKLQGLTKLTGLTLAGTRITDAGLAHLKALSDSLEFVDLQKTNVSDAGLEHLQGLRRLRNLNLSDTAVSSDGVERLQKALPKVKVER